MGTVENNLLSCVKNWRVKLNLFAIPGGLKDKNTVKEPREVLQKGKTFP